MSWPPTSPTSLQLYALLHIPLYGVFSQCSKANSFCCALESHRLSAHQRCASCNHQFPLLTGSYHLRINILKCGPPLTSSLDPIVTASYHLISLFHFIVKLKWNQSKFAVSTFSSPSFSGSLSNQASGLIHTTEIILLQATSDFCVVKHSDPCPISPGSASAASDIVLTSLAQSHLPESPSLLPILNFGMSQNTSAALASLMALKPAQAAPTSGSLRLLFSLLRMFFPYIYISSFLSSFRSLLKCHLTREVFQNPSISSRPHIHHSIPPTIHPSTCIIVSHSTYHYSACYIFFCLASASLI